MPQTPKAEQPSEEFLRRVVASSPDCIKVLDLEGNLLSMNDGGQKVLEINDLTPHLGSCWTGWWAGEARQEALRAVDEALRGGMGRFEAFAKNFGGTPMWWDVTVSPMLGAGGKVEQLLSVSRDITRRKLAEQEAVLLSEQRRLALDSAQMGSWQFDLASERIHWDERFKAIFGVADEELSYERVVELLHPDDRENVRTAIAAASRPIDPVPYSIAYRVIHPDGSEHWIEAHGRTYFEGEGRTRRATSLVGTVRDITAQRASEEALRVERELLRTVFDQAPDDAILVMDASHTLTAWNPAAERITGWTATEAIGQTADIIFTPEDRAVDMAKQETDTAAREGKASDERWHLRQDGSRFWGSGTMNALHDPDGRVRGYLKVFRDATARHEETETLAYFQRLTDELLDHPSSEQIIEIVQRLLGEHLRASRVLVTEASEDGQSVTVQQAWTQPGLKDLAGTYRLADFGSRIAADYAAGRPHVRRDAEREYPPGTELDNLRAVQAIASLDVPVRIDGRLRFVVVVHQTTPLDWTDREVNLVQQVADRMAVEVQRARAERALAFERHQLELIFRESPAEMATWRGEDLVFTRVNPKYQNLFSTRQLVGLPVLDAIPELAGQGFDDLLKNVLRTGKPFIGREVLAKIQREKDGPVEDRYFDFTYLQICDADDRPWGVYDHSMDVTDRVQARLAVEQSQKDLREALADREQLLQAEQAARSEAERVSQMKDEFLATLSHELRTPLNAILGWTQVLRGDPANTEDMEAGLATIERNSRAQTQIIEDLLDMSKIISGKVRLDVQPLQLDEVIAASVDTMRPAAAAKGIRLQALVDPQARMISGDPNRLQQVFWNLLSNAIKFTPKGGKVQVVLERVNSHLEVSIADTGEGIAPEFLPYVFDRFRQQDASTTRKHGGLGLGLAIVKQLVELHGGRVQVESAGSGQGTTFKVLLPLSVVQPARHPDDSERRHPQGAGTALPIPADRLNLAGIKVLVVDDEADARALVQRLLENRGATVRAVGSAAEAIGLLPSQRPDVLVSEIGMPEEDGYALIKQVRALPAEQGGSTPAVALTAYARSEDRLKVILAGFQMHMAKPVEAAELLALVASLAGRVAGH